MDKELLGNMLENKDSIQDISNKTDKAKTTVRYWISKFGLKANGKAGPKPKRKCGRKSCLFCNKELTIWGRNFCSNKCQQNFRYKDYIAKWIKGDEGGEQKKQRQKTNTRKEGLARQVRRYVLEESKGMCSICGNSEWQENPIPLVLDHIDGNPCNHRPENLRMVCGNCNMQLPTFTGRNKGKGRENRRDWYKKNGYS